MCRRSHGDNDDDDDDDDDDVFLIHVILTFTLQEGIQVQSLHE